MSLDEFRELVDSCGCRLANWPAKVRKDAERLLLASLPARELLNAAAELEVLLQKAEPVSAPKGLLDRICQAVDEHEQNQPKPPDALPFQSRPEAFGGRGACPPTVLLYRTGAGAVCAPQETGLPTAAIISLVPVIAALWSALYLWRVLP